MPDFYQHARVPTLHHLAGADLREKESQIQEWTRGRGVALLMPALYAEFERPALPRILEEVAGIPYVTDVVLSINGTSADQHRSAHKICANRLNGKKFTVLWNDGPPMQKMYSQMEEAGCPEYTAGKGTNVWSGLAYLHATGHTGIVIGHDSDILSYERDMLWRLAYPLVHPGMPYRFVKGYYSRVGERLYGRTTRLMVFPLIQTLTEVLGHKPLLTHLDDFRYPLAGEFAGGAELLSRFPLPSGWGLEIAMLCEVHRRMTPSEMCQVDLGANYEHNHRALDQVPNEGQGGRDYGLAEAAADVAKCLFHQVLRDAEERAAESLLQLVCERYRPKAAEWIDRYEHVAQLNGLLFDREEEQWIADAFARALRSIIADGDQSTARERAMRPPVAELLEAAPDIRRMLVEAGG